MSGITEIEDGLISIVKAGAFVARFAAGAIIKPGSFPELGWNFRRREIPDTKINAKLALEGVYANFVRTMLLVNTVTIEKFSNPDVSPDPISLVAVGLLAYYGLDAATTAVRLIGRKTHKNA
ncbi:MAG: hypothetical protein UX91_C0004G0008 [Candidatus Amesbacteria bacterium GW2011_GWB1_47_19]|nr:MAG: hypothetical protein UW51_C0005G0008 [Candidatus Amesbacteria bacterium GW2011_GWA1_44_24]KKU31565.1 MAG: hypothetical protein UX46_C0004G0008 [Candidatus Amesbacteria bacterium GW2011_GWC1_46_24]KKU67338.1 MAG: hypothetical protein UX91_C0004G0008 [Candidatus Amesbacteria bacterium GW2011_GWB1_47_19]OGD05246.1 MAG: hypothetical protein A2379_04540 [Candidatus Amesbacteria bacterium RIFOXYB1_FULL_47_13]HBC72612.1 hypothetical protein [Candidatus Amesbacteria bacterium]